jgi:hypothetical protein
MFYVDVTWKHESPDQPIRMVSELDAERFEVRKLEFFASGTIGHASSHYSTSGTMLGEMPVPALSEINGDPQFAGREIDAATFESLWKGYAVGQPT